MGIDAIQEKGTLESKVILFGLKEEGGAVESFPVHSDKILFDKGWMMRPLRRSKAGLHDYKIEDRKNEPYIDVALRNWGKYLGEYYSGDVEYEIEFEYSKELDGRKAFLDLGEVGYV